jgi:hypothetical protein
MSRVLAAAVVTAAALAASASATEVTIVPGVGIGKLELGMTQEQVVRVLGKDYLVNERATVGGATYRELAWNFASWSVGFLHTGSTWRVIQVDTTVRQQRTAAGVGVGSLFEQVVQRHPTVFCGSIDSTYGSGRYKFSSTALILVNKGPVYTAFAVEPVERTQYDGPWRVYSVIVQRAVPGHVSLGQVPRGDKTVQYRCRDGWRERGTP